jgi:hypothetical protein
VNLHQGEVERVVDEMCQNGVVVIQSKGLGSISIEQNETSTKTKY